MTNVNVTRTGGPGSFHRVTLGGPVGGGDQCGIRYAGAEGDAGAGRPAGRRPRCRANTLSLYAPRIHTSTTTVPGRVGMSVTQTSINHGLDVTRPLVVNSSLIPTAPTAEQIQHAHESQSQTPSNAKVFTDASMIKPIMSAPVTSLKPVIGATGHTSSFTNGASPAPGGQTYVPQNRVFSQPGEQVFNTQPQEQQRVTTPGTYNPYTPRQVTPAPSTPSTSAPAGGSHLYVSPAPSTSAPSGHVSSTSGTGSTTDTSGLNVAPSSSSTTTTPSGGGSTGGFFPPISARGEGGISPAGGLAV